MALDAMSKVAAYKDIQPQKAEYNPQNQQKTPAPLAVAAPAVPVEDTAKGSGKDSKNRKEENQMKEAVKQINRKGQFGHTNAQFEYHEATKRVSIKLIDNETNEVIKEIPPEETLEMISKMWELAGILVDKKG